MFLLKMCVSCKRELDFQGLGTLKNMKKGVCEFRCGAGMRSGITFFMILGGFGEALGSLWAPKVRFLRSKSEVRNLLEKKVSASEDLLRAAVPEKEFHPAPPLLLFLKDMQMYLQRRR